MSVGTVDRARTEIADFGINMEVYRCEAFDPRDQLAPYPHKPAKRVCVGLFIF
ncbi:MAG: hypothetical protein LBF78_15740 [Treponema sp.]|nr:hypothetical protein [Treponema sp.]